MYILSINMWFQTLMRQFFFNLDRIIYGFISSLYDLIISIARTSVLSQADIADMADRIYKLLAIFMVFKVTFSLIMYVVNPDDFTDKEKGVSKLGLNIMISLGLLVLTPYIFNMAFQLQTIILEDNSIAAIIFGKKAESKSGVNYLMDAGDSMEFIAMQPFFYPDSSLNVNGENVLAPCTQVYDFEGQLNDECMTALESITDDYNFSSTTLATYKRGLETKNHDLIFRQDLATATYNNETFVMDYKYLFSTAIGIVIVLLLLSYCMDIAVRSLKLAFLQLIAPIPIISYVDPKSGKDGLFKKWYQMCFKTFLSLFIRLLAIYFAIYIISMVADLKLVDVINGSYVRSKLIGLFVLIGALIFAKQFPKILEGLGIKLDDKFTLNPLKKIENEALGGKQIAKGVKNTARAAGGFASGLALGAVGAATGAGKFKWLTGALSGATDGFKGKKMGEIHKKQVEANQRMRTARLNGSTVGGRMGERFAGFTGSGGAMREIEAEKQDLQHKIDVEENEKKSIEARIAPIKTSIALDENVDAKISAMNDRAVKKIKEGDGDEGRKYQEMLRQAAQEESNGNGDYAEEIRQLAEKKLYSDFKESWINNNLTAPGGDQKLKDIHTEYEAAATTAGRTVETTAAGLKKQSDNIGSTNASRRNSITSEETKIKKHDDTIKKYNDQMQDIVKRENVAKANQNAIK